MPVRWNDLRYSGSNVVILWSTMIERGYRSPKFMTWNKADELGGHVRRGEHGAILSPITNLPPLSLTAQAA
jgi:antirestriction protein ArdC